MDSDGLPIVGSGIDYTKVGAIHQKRTLAFLNHFVTHTVRFLNRFSCVCEEKLSNLSNRIQRLETTISNLEAKLSSIPGLENVTVKSIETTTQQTSTQDTTNSDTTATQAQTPTAPDTQPDTTAAVAEAPAVEEAPVMTVAQDPRYAKYFKMMNMGVPAGALRQRVILDGLDPDLLDTPNAPAPSAPNTTQNNDDEASDLDDDLSDDSSGFSD